MAGRHRRPRPSAKPVKKVSAATAAAAAAGLAFEALAAVGVQVPRGTQLEVTTLLVFAAGWLKRP